MENTPNIDVASSDQNLNQRFKKPKSNLVMIVVAAVLGIGLIVTAILMTQGGGQKDGQEKQADKKDDSAKSAPSIGLSKNSLTLDLMEGDEAKFAVSTILKNAVAEECRIEWNVPKSTLPRTSLEKVVVNQDLSVTFPTDGLAIKKSKDSVVDTAEYQLVGTIAKGDSTTEEFTLSIKLSLANQAPKVVLPEVAGFDPMVGGGIAFSYSDRETPDSELNVQLNVADEYRDSFSIVDNRGGKAIQYLPKQFKLEDILVEIVVVDEEGESTQAKMQFRYNPSDKSVVLFKKLEQIPGLEIDGAKVDTGFPGGMKLQVGQSNVQIVQLPPGPNDGDPKMFPKLAEPYLVFLQDRLMVACEKPSEKLSEDLKKVMGEPIADKKMTKVEVAESKSKLVQTAESLFEDKKLFQSKSFSDLVFAYVEDFEKQNRVVLNQKYSDLAGLKEFLDENKGFKAELFLAIDPLYDNLASALNVIHQIKESHPKAILPYKNLAIAIAVCWDVPQANYSFVGHQRRTKSIMPKNLTGAVENFKHFVSYQNQMQGRAQWMPWEFLVHVINHQTPDQEKNWALQNYLANRVNFGKCYKDVPYDYEMLNTGSKVCKLNGAEYSLPNLRSIGGVCAMQADFAARVGKSLGVPAEYVGGKSASGGNHAWVVWVEVKNVTKTSIQFSLESYGRYRGDLYYVGTLKDPKSGQRITDRQLELRLHTVGSNAYAKRQVDLIMKAYPELVKSQEMDLKDQLDFLESTIKLCPWHEQAWETVANLIANNEIDRKMNRQMNQILNSMFAHFSAFPDFTWKIFDRLVSFVQKDEDRNKYYVKLLNLYVEGKRPDLACEAQLKLTDYLEEQEKTEVAMQGLAVTIKTFPDEGRYVPRLLDRLEKLCGDDPNLLKPLVQFHIEFLPMIPQKRGSRASKYCMQMYERAIQFFSKHGVTDYANSYRLKLQELQAIK